MIEKENYRWICLFLMLLLIVFAAASCSNGNNRTGINTTGNKLEQAGNNQQKITGGIDNAEKSAGRIESGIGEARILIEDCQRILRGIRERNEVKAETAKNAA